MEDTEHAPVQADTKSPRYQKEFREAAYLLAMWSILVMNEGVIRFIRHGMPNAPGLFTGPPAKPIRFWSPMLGGLFGKFYILGTRSLLLYSTLTHES